MLDASVAAVAALRWVRAISAAGIELVQMRMNIIDVEERWWNEC
jgi:hypothetical protein